MDSRRCSRMVVRIPLFLSPLIAFPALAQQALEEIVVTARMRTENYANGTRCDQGVHGRGDRSGRHRRACTTSSQLTPNMTVVQTQNPGNTFITIRGISQARNSDMPVAVVVDGVLMTNPAAVQPGALRHPADRGAEGPARRALRAQRDRRRDQHRHQAGNRQVRGARCAWASTPGPGYLRRVRSSGPIGDKWKYRAALSYSDTDGYLEKRFLTRRPIRTRTSPAALRFTWEPSDKVTGDFRYSASHIDTTALYFVINDDYGLGRRRRPEASM